MPGGRLAAGRTARRSAALLQDAARVGAAPPSGALPADVLEAVGELAPLHRVTGFAVRALRHRVEATEVIEALRVRSRVGAALQLRSVLDLTVIAAALAAAGTSWVLVKGPALAETVYEEPADRTFSDLDIVVAGTQFGAAVEALEAAGAVVTDQEWSLLEHELRGQLHLALPSGTPIDLHWHLLNRLRVRSAFTLDMRALLARRVPLDIGSVQVATLERTDTLLHVCLHAALSGGHRLSWYVDVDRVVRRRPPDWDALVGRAEQWGARAAAGAVLARARQVMGTPVPRPVLQDLIGPAWRQAVAALERIEPLGSVGGEHRLSSLLLPTARDTARPGISPRLARVASVATRGWPPGFDRSGSRESFLAAVAAAQ